jgi:hypothetical protein
MIIKQTVYLPVIEDREFYLSDSSVTGVVKKEGYFFTLEQLNEYTASVIKQALEIAAENAEIKERRVTYSSSSGSEYGYVQSINKQSITKTFEETFTKFKV